MLDQVLVTPPAPFPLLTTCDLLVAGGSFGAVAAALSAARAGMKVALLEWRTYLGREVTATLRPWLENAPASLPPLVRSCLDAAGIESAAPGLWLFRTAALKTHLEDLLLSAGVELYYACLPVALLTGSERLAGIVVGAKGGRYTVRAPLAVDASETALLARLAGAAYDAPPRPCRYLRTLEFDGVGKSAPLALPSMLDVPSELGIPGNRVRLLPGSQGESHAFVEVPLTLSGPPAGARAWTQLEIAARQRSMALAAHLLKQEPAFHKAYLAAASPLLSGPLTPVPTFAEGDLPLGLHLLPESFSLSGSDPIAAAAAGELLGASLRSVSPPSASLASLAMRSDGSLPALHADVLVAGGGTSGATAATIAGREGARTLLVELNTGLGGTGTVGGVHSYWFGRRVGYAREVIAAVEAVHARLGMPPPVGSLLKWNIEAKLLALLERALDAGVEPLFGSIACAALVEGNRVCGALAATPYGPLLLRAKTVVDATGDGDLAVLAGAQAVYGAERDHTTMWFSLAQFHKPGQTNNNFTSMVDVGNPADYTRAVLAGRRRARGYEAGAYVAPRESRHVLGDATLTLTGQLRKRRWPDVVSLAFSNHDVKGHTTSDFVKAGLIPPNLEIEVPYRALLPRGLEGILVTGKAISATHDAQPAVRMQPDMENLGGVAGLAAALSALRSANLRALDVADLQARLAAAGVLPDTLLHRHLTPRRYATRAGLEALFAQVDLTRPLTTYQDMELDEVYQGSLPLVELCCAGLQVVPFLAEKLRAASGEARLMIARALALTGSQAGVPDLIEAIHAATPDEGLQYRSAHVRHANLPPDQGAMPEAANLLYTLGMARDPRALPVWEHFAGLVAACGEEDLRDRRLGLFYYVDAICYGAERLGDPRAVPLLRAMRANPMFHGRVSQAAFEVDFFLERQAYLELVIARAMARCGDPAGLEALIAYLGDNRALLARHARSELSRITGADFGYDSAAWSAWLTRNRSHLQPAPLDEPNEPVRAWGEEIY